MGLMDWLNIAGFAIGIIGVVQAVFQTIKARKIRNFYEEKCETRCKDLVEIITIMSSPVALSCKIKDEEFDTILKGDFDKNAIIRPIRQLSDQIHAIAISKDQLVRFCERLNDEHKADFGKSVFENIRSKFYYYLNKEKGIVKYNDL